MRAVIFSGGGVKGAYHLGVLRALLEYDPTLDYDLYAGVSVGALHAGLLSTGTLSEKLPELERIWLNIDGSKSIWRHHLWYYIIFDICIILLLTLAAFISFILTAPKWLTLLIGLLVLLSFYLPYYSLTHSHSIYNNNPLRELILNSFDEKDIVKDIVIGAVSYNTGKYRIITKDDNNLKEWFVASSAVPIFFRMPKIDGEYWLDGGISEISLLNHVLSLGYEDIDIILTSPPKKPKSIFGEAFPGIHAQLMRFIEIISAEISYNDFYIRYLSSVGVKVRVFYPKDNLIRVNSLSFDPKQIRYMYDTGLEDTINGFIPGCKRSPTDE